MKRFLCIFLCLSALFSLCSCGRDEQPEDDTSELFTDDGVEADDWINPLLAEAEMVYAWFAGGNSPACSSDTIELDGAYYALVLESGLTDSAALCSRLDELFTADIAERLMATEVYSGVPVFRDFDGRLYYCTGTHGEVPWDIGQRTCSIVSQTETEIILHVDIRYDYYSTVYSAGYDYRLVAGENGQWRFASFKLPASLIAEQMFKPDHAEE